MAIQCKSKIAEQRIKLHKRIITKMSRLGLCTSEYHIEAFKRWFLWNYFKVETSKSFDLKQIEGAIKTLRIVSKNKAVKGIKEKYSQFERDRDLVRCTNAQKKKIQAIAYYRIKLDSIQLAKYTYKTFGRRIVGFDMTIDEADQLIKRLEQWEVKLYKNGALTRV